MAMYSALVYPQTPIGQGYGRPPQPSTFTTFYGMSPHWDPYGANPDDRSEFWEDTAGTMTENEVLLKMWGIPALKEQQLAILYESYLEAISQSVTFTTEGNVTAMFAADSDSAVRMTQSVVGCMLTETTPTGFFWMSTSGDRVPFTYADLKGVSAVAFAQGAVAFVHLADKRDDVEAATTVDDIRAIVW